MKAKFSAENIRQRRNLCVVSLLLLATAFVLRSVSAHATVLSSDPMPGETVAAVPEIVLTFSEPMGEASLIALVDNNFGRIELGVTVNENRVIATTPALEAGVYTVQYDAISADGHNILGSYEFALAPPASVGSGLMLVAILIVILLLMPLAAIMLYRRNRSVIHSAES